MTVRKSGRLRAVLGTARRKRRAVPVRGVAVNSPVGRNTMNREKAASLTLAIFVALQQTSGADEGLFSKALGSFGQEHTAVVEQIITNKAVSPEVLQKRGQSTNIMEAVLADYVALRLARPMDVARYDAILNKAAASVYPYHVWRLGMCTKAAESVTNQIGKDGIPFLGEVVLFGLNCQDAKDREIPLRRTIAILVLGEIEDQRTTEILCHCLKCGYLDQREDNPVAYAFRNKGRKAADALVRAIENEQDPWKSLVAGNALAILGDSRTGSILAGVLGDKGKDEYDFFRRVRLAARILRDHPDEKSRAALIEVQGLRDSYADKLVRDAIASIDQSSTNRMEQLIEK